MSAYSNICAKSIMIYSRSQCIGSTQLFNLCVLNNETVFKRYYSMSVSPHNLLHFGILLKFSPQKRQDLWCPNDSFQLLFIFLSGETCDSTNLCFKPDINFEIGEIQHDSNLPRWFWVVPQDQGCLAFTSVLW